MNKDKINSLIWGKFESEIIQLKLPLWEYRYLMKTKAMDGAYALFNGFLTFLMFKLGYHPKLPEDFKSDLEDNSWWVKNLDEPEFMSMSFSFDDENGENISPFVFKQFFNEIGKDITVCILLDWHTFYECGLAIKKSKLSEDLKYSDKIKEEFHLTSEKNFGIILNYMKELNNKDFADAHKLILRPDKLADYIITLNELYTDLETFPNDIYVKEEWEKMSIIEKFANLPGYEFKICTEKNFEQLLEKAGIIIPNIEFQNFNHFLQDKFDISISGEWSEIRDKFISKLKDYLIDSDDAVDPKDYGREKEFLQKAQDFFERKEFEESNINCCKSLEGVLSKKFNLPKEMPMWKMICRCKKDPNCRIFVDHLKFISNRRNKKGAHYNSAKAEEEDSRLVLDTTNYVFQGITNEKILGKYDAFEK